MINAIIEKRNSGTLITEFPRNIYDLYSELRSIGIMVPPGRIKLTDEEEEPICVKLYADSDIGNHLIRIFREKDSLEDVNNIASVVIKSSDLIRQDLEQQILNDQYASPQELYQDIYEMLYEAGSVSETFYFPLVGRVCEEGSADSSEVDNQFLADYEKEIREVLNEYMKRDTQNMAEYYNDIGNEKLLIADWNLVSLHGVLYGKVDIRLTEPMTIGEKARLKEWICGQNSDGAGEGFEQRDIQIEDGVLNVSFWNSGGDYFIYDQLEMDEYIENRNGDEMTMNEWERNRLMAEQYRESYPPGTRIMLLDTSETLQPVPVGMKGTVAYIDDQSQIHMKWDNGRTLAVIPGEDTFRKLTAEELAEEQAAKQTAEREEDQDDGIDEENGPVMGM